MGTLIEKYKKILICENEINECNGILEKLKENNFNVTVSPKDGEEVLKYINERHPSIVICDAHMPNKDAILVMRQAMKYSSDTPKFIIITSSGSIELERVLFSEGANYLVLRPYTTDSLINAIKVVSKQIKDVNKPPTKEHTLEEKITNIIHRIGVPAHIKGYHYLRKGIMLCVENSSILKSVTKELYPAIAEYFKSTPSRVERAIRHAIEVAWDRGDIEILNSYFGYTIHNGRGKPTNSEFIAMISDKIKLERNSSVVMNIAI